MVMKKITVTRWEIQCGFGGASDGKNRLVAKKNKNCKMPHSNFLLMNFQL